MFGIRGANGGTTDSSVDLEQSCAANLSQGARQQQSEWSMKT
jgi:hypothetical protein